MNSFPQVDHLEGAVVRVGSDNMYGENPQCGDAVTAAEATAGAEVEFLCGDTPLCGTYLAVQQAPGKFLTFCEIWAYEPLPHDMGKFIQVGLWRTPA